MTIAANSIGLSPVGASLNSAPETGDSPVKQTSIGSFTIGSISSAPVTTQSESFGGTAGLLSLNVIGFIPTLRVSSKTYSIGSHSIGKLSSHSEFISSAYQDIAVALNLEVEGLWPSLAVEIGQEFEGVATQLQLSVEGLSPELIVDQILGYDRRATIRFLESSGGKPSLAPSADFPPIGMNSFYDSSKFVMEQDDPAIKQTTDGGYVISRPRYLTKPKNTYQVQFTSIQESDKELLEAFWNSTMGGTESFTFKTPFGQIVKARFAPSSPMKFVYRGQGYKRLWDATGIKIVEV